MTTVLDSSIVIAALSESDLRARHRRLRPPDALVIGTAHALDAVTVLTTDAVWARFSDRVQVVT